jgi:hypothetical protein
MKQYIKDDKIYNLPITINTVNGNVILTNDEELILANGYKEYVYI